MEITEVRISKVNSKGKLKAFATVVFDKQFMVHDLRIIKREGEDTGYFVAMPSVLSSEGSFRDIAHPLNQEFRDRLTQAVMERYFQETSQQE